MQFEIRPLPKEDAREAALLVQAAYKNNPFRQLLWPDGTPSGLVDKVLERIEKTLSDPECSAVQIYDTSAQKMAALALWNYTRPKNDEEWDREAVERPDSLGTLSPTSKDIIVPFLLEETAAKRRIMGSTRWWELDTLSTAPEYQRKGLGSMLMKWGIEQLEERSVPSVIVSTEAGKSTYLKHGYETLGTWGIELGNHGGTRRYENSILVRHPSKKAA